MNNIWGFILQTFQVSLVSAVILIIKKTFRDKLPPLWQYRLWIVPLCSMVVPRGLNGIWLWKEGAVWIMAVKTTVENMLSSVYTNRQNIVYNTGVLPVIKKPPQSITDILFVIYIIYFTICILKCLFSYIKIGYIIKKAGIDNNIQAAVDSVAEKYRLKSCKVKILDCLPSPFVFGIFNPVMILPRNKPTDEKVILHELLHLKYFDLQQKVVWSFFRALHGVNPFMRYVFRQIDNDIESLRDNRVLQLLEGEERRDYGRVLLDMTNEKYPSAFGTSSISNGSRFIAQRIETIARFKKYPKGMELASVCIVIMLLPVAIGKDKGNETVPLTSAIPVLVQDYHGNQLPNFNYYWQREKVKMINVPNISGATDVFVKASIQNSEHAMLAVKPENSNNNFVKPDYSKIVTPAINGELTYMLTGYEQTDENHGSGYILYRFYESEPEQTPSDSSDRGHVSYSQGKASSYTGQVLKHTGTHTYIVPVEFTKENGGWKVSQSADSSYYFTHTGKYLRRIPTEDEYTGGIQKFISTPYGRIKLHIDNIQKFNPLPFYPMPDINIKFEQQQRVVYSMLEADESLKERQTVTIALATFDDLSRIPEIPYDYSGFGHTEHGATEDMTYYYNFHALEYFWENEFLDGKLEAEIRSDNFDLSLPGYVMIELSVDGEKVCNYIYDVQAGDIIG